MNNFMELNEYSKKILSSLIDSDTISRLIFYNKPDVLDKDSNSNYIYEKPIASDLTYSHIYPYKFIPDLSEDNKTYITFSLHKIKKCNTNTLFKFNTLTFYILIPIDNDVIRTNEGLRFYIILNEIHKLFYNKNSFGVGKLDFIDSDTLMIDSTRYCGYYVSYGIYD